MGRYCSDRTRARHAGWLNAQEYFDFSGFCRKIASSKDFTPAPANLPRQFQTDWSC